MLDQSFYNNIIRPIPVSSRVEFVGEEGGIHIRESVGKNLIRPVIKSSIFINGGYKPIENSAELKPVFSMPFSRYVIFKFLLNVGFNPILIQFNYTEVQSTPLIFQAILHIPLILSGIIIFAIVLSLNPKSGFDYVSSVINRLPCQTFKDDSPIKECSICLESFDLTSQLRVLPCNHHFHRECADVWLRNGMRCPLCRRCIVQQPVYPLETYQPYI